MIHSNGSLHKQAKLDTFFEARCEMVWAPDVPQLVSITCDSILTISQVDGSFVIATGPRSLLGRFCSISDITGPCIPVHAPFACLLHHDCAIEVEEYETCG